jgi:Coenzyme PQQ synthesis protein D (PqqD)
MIRADWIPIESKGANQMKMFPKARQEKLVVREFADELLVYDKERHEAHCLNRTAALVWKHCDGRTSVAEISRRLANEMAGGAPVDERLVWYALNQFKRDHLLEEKLEVPAGMLMNGGLNRRQVMRVLGISIVALPLVTSLIAPTPAQAATCLAPGAACTSGTQCCNGVCQGNNTCL